MMELHELYVSREIILLIFMSSPLKCNSKYTKICNKDNNYIFVIITVYRVKIQFITTYKKSIIVKGMKLLNITDIFAVKCPISISIR